MFATSLDDDAGRGRLRDFPSTRRVIVNSPG
jgi:hypothetical protein